MVPNVPLSAWEVYARTDILLAALAVVAAAGALLRSRRSGALITIGAATVAALVVLRLYSGGDPGHGGKLALLSAAVVVAAGVVRLIGLEERLASSGRRLTPWAHRVARVVGSTWVLGPVLAYVTFPLRTLATGGGTDGSWVTALHLAAQQGLQWGTQVVFTYGPLGYLTVPRLIDRGLAIQGVAYVCIVHLALTIALLAAARRTFPLPIALVVAAIAAKAMYVNGESAQTAAAVFVFAACVAVLRASVPVRARWWLPLVAVGGALAAFQALIKLNTAAMTIALVLIAVLVAAPAGRRLLSAGVLAGTFAVFLVAFWIAWGQDLGALPDYVRHSAAIVKGFQEYMYTEADGRQWEYYGAALVLGILAATTVHALPGLTRRRRIGLVAMVAVFAFAWFKQGFVRHDGHSIDFFAALLGAGIVVGWDRARGHRAFGYAAVASLLIAFFAAGRPVPRDFQSLSAGPDAFAEMRRDIGDASAFIDDQRGALRQAEEIDPGTLALLRGHTVHSFPTEAAVAFAYPEMKWDPLPVFQGYSAYTDDLDRLNAAKLQGRDAPERLLRSTEYSPFEDPRAVRAVFCRYRELRAGSRWQVLARAANRCGPLRSLGRTAVGIGQQVEVPAVRPDEAVLVAVHHMGPDAKESLRALVCKPYDRSLLYDDGRTRRVATGLAEVPSLLRVPAALDYSGPFRMDDRAKSVAPMISSEGVLAAPAPQPRRVDVEFFAMPVTGPAVER